MIGTAHGGKSCPALQALPVIWAAAEERGRAPGYYPPPEYAYTSPLSFTTSDLQHLRTQLCERQQQIDVLKAEQAGITESARKMSSPFLRSSPGALSASGSVAWR